MSNLLKYLLIALLIFFLGAWIFTVVNSCKEKKNDIDVVENPISTSDTDDGTADLDDLYANDGDEGNLKATNDDSLDDLYDDEIDESAVAAAKKAAMAEVEETGNELTADLDRPSSNNAGTNRSSANSAENYLVVAASYLSEANAKAELRNLKKAGYNDAEVVVFDLSQYYTLLANRYDNLREANALKSKLLKSRYPDAYVHRKRKRK